MDNQRPKLELQINLPMQLELIYDTPITGENKYGAYYCYSFRDSKGEEFSFFAPEKIHNVLRDQVKGAKIKLVKTAVEKNKKLIQDYEIEVLSNGKKNGKATDPTPEQKSAELTHLDIMKQCFTDATEIQKEFNSVNLNQIAVTLYISRTKMNGNGGLI